MGRIARSQEYENALNLAEAGQYDNALDYFRRHLSSYPNDAEAFNDAGTVLYCMGRVDEAIEHFEKALDLSDKSASAEIYWNLCEACIDGKHPQRAAELLEDMDAIQILNPDILNRLADCFLQDESFGPAAEILLKSLEMSPNQEILYPMVEVLRSKRPKIAFFCQHGHSRMSNIYEYLNKRFLCEIHSSKTIEQVNNIAEWADICWFEGLTEQLSQFLLRETRCKVIVRITVDDKNTRLPAYINFNNVDVLIVTDQSLKQYLERAGFDPRTHNTQLVISSEFFNSQISVFTDKQRGKNIACIDGLNFKSNPMLLLQCMQKLNYLDPQYKLFFSGDFKDSQLENYLRYMVSKLNLNNVIYFDGPVADFTTWLKDKHYIVSATLTDENFPAVRTGVASGLKPVVANFPGAEALVDRRFIFNISEDFCRLVLDESFEPQTYRELAGLTTGSGSPAEKICRVIQKLEEEILNFGRSTVSNTGSVEIDVQGISVTSYTPAINDSSTNRNEAAQVQTDVSVYSNHKVFPIMPISVPSVNQLEAESQPIDVSFEDAIDSQQQSCQNVQPATARHSVKRANSLEEIAAKALRASESLTRMINEQNSQSQEQTCFTDAHS